MPAVYPYTQYSGIWTMQQVDSAIAAGTWPVAYNNNAALYAWGYNPYGGLGTGNTTAYSSPKAVGSASTWLALASGYFFTTAVKTDGTLWGFGQNSNGQLGLGNASSIYSSPKQIGALTNWSKVANGNYFAAAIKTDGTLWTWGNNPYGQLGIGNVTSYSSPKQVGSLTNWSKISVMGAGSMAAIKTDGTLWSWGYNAFGQLGIGTSGAGTNVSSPTQVGSLTNWLQIAAGYNFMLAIKTDGTLWSWGYNVYGQLGLGNITYKSSPNQIGALTTWSTPGASYYASFVTKTDGTLWVWGSGRDGQLGLGNRTDYSSPKQLGGLTNWSSAKGSNGHAVAIKTDGTLWTWGNGTLGGLGLGNTTYYSSPKQVGSLTNWLLASAGGYNTIAIATA